MMHPSNDRPELRLFVRSGMSVKVPAAPRPTESKQARLAHDEPAQRLDIPEEPERWDGLS
jgi:hypothetical protein